MSANIDTITLGGGCFWCLEAVFDKVGEWEAAFYRYMDANHPEIGQEIVEHSVKEKNKMSRELLDQLKAAIEEFIQTAAPS